MKLRLWDGWLRVDSPISGLFCLPTIRLCVCVSDLALLLFSDFLMPMPKTRRPRKQKKKRTGEKKIVSIVDGLVFSPFVFCFWPVRFARAFYAASSGFGFGSGGLSSLSHSIGIGISVQRAKGVQSRLRTEKLSFLLLLYSFFLFFSFRFGPAFFWLYASWLGRPS